MGFMIQLVFNQLTTDNLLIIVTQTLKLQEAPDHIPTGDMPRHIQLYVDRALVDKMVPGNRVQVTQTQGNIFY